MATGTSIDQISTFFPAEFFFFFETDESKIRNDSFKLNHATFHHKVLPASATLLHLSEGFHNFLHHKDKFLFSYLPYELGYTQPVGEIFTIS